MQPSMMEGEGDVMHREVSLNGALKALIGNATATVSQDDESVRLARELEAAVNALEAALQDGIAEVRVKTRAVTECMAHKRWR